MSPGRSETTDTVITFNSHSRIKIESIESPIYTPFKKRLIIVENEKKEGEEGADDDDGNYLKVLCG